jgi:hypothetical protein
LPKALSRFRSAHTIPGNEQFNEIP